MKKSSLKKSVAIVLAASMTFASAMTVFAEAGTLDGTGSYEGGELKYPTLSVTLPTIPAGTYDYIADPNGLIAATNNEKYQGATFDANAKGVFFLTDSTAKKYSAKSAAQTLKNENAQDIDVTIKLEQKTAGDASIKYADTATFGTGDKENKLYLAVTDDAQTNAKVSALSADTAATITTKVDGVPANYEAKYTQADGYGYVKKTSGLTDWNECSFIMTGALNNQATWGDNLTFPAITVTWSYAEHDDAVANATVAHCNIGDDGKLYISASSSAGFSESPSAVKVNGTNATFSCDEWGWVSMDAPASGSVILLTVGGTNYKVTAP